MSIGSGGAVPPHLSGSESHSTIQETEIFKIDLKIRELLQRYFKDLVVAFQYIFVDCGFLTYPVLRKYLDMSCKNILNRLKQTEPSKQFELLILMLKIHELVYFTFFNNCREYIDEKRKNIGSNSFKIPRPSLIDVYNNIQDQSSRCISESSISDCIHLIETQIKNTFDVFMTPEVIAVTFLETTWTPIYRIREYLNSLGNQNSVKCLSNSVVSDD